MMCYPFPRARGDIESAARARAFAWRGVLAFAVIYLALLIGLVWKFASVIAAVIAVVLILVVRWLRRPVDRRDFDDRGDSW